MHTHVHARAQTCKVEAVVHQAFQRISRHEVTSLNLERKTISPAAALAQAECPPLARCYRTHLSSTGRPSGQLSVEPVCECSDVMPQNDIHSPQATVREALWFSARLRLGPEVNNAACARFISEVPSFLGPFGDAGSPLAIDSWRRKAEHCADAELCRQTLGRRS